MGLYSIITKLFQIYMLLIVIWCIMSWIPRGNSTVDSIRDALGSLVEPWLNLFRRLIPPFGGIDFSPIVALFALELIERLILSILF
jgi:uncharacterized protein YggT (Ycf19 family)